ncbi:hypothetical protein BB559_005853 [Furculomyces boomerangus]|uniref:Uncharacterized protein n=2 Tax=Harpellales TaxID=61421 RepID=A0A2T9Y6B9_9FUNG|nr:hypothetical protein BB559_005853 [Furculomyces boomerangus]PWA02680.1 hypothetical protein BB558_001182 [Smittium angustum]
MSVFDLKTQYVKYGEYHSNPINVISHQIFVPSIMWSTLGFLSLTGPYMDVPSFLLPLFGPSLLSVEMNLATILCLTYIVYYLSLDFVAALIYTPLMLLMLSTSFFVMNNAQNPLTIMTVVFVVSWAVQVAGHFVFEKRAPALLDNLLQAFAMAPFFVFLEILFKFGYRPEFHKEVNALIADKVRIFHESKATPKKKE